MTATVTLDKAGRIVIPKPMRDKMRLDAGDRLEVLYEGQSLTLRSARVAGRLHNKLRFWVLDGTQRITSEETDAVLRRVRDQRNRHNRGDRRQKPT